MRRFYVFTSNYIINSQPTCDIFHSVGGTKIQAELFSVIDPNP